MKIAINNQGLAKIPIVNNDESSLKAFKALNISITTSTVSDKVEAFCLPTVKYEHGFSLKLYLPKLLTAKSVKVVHSLQLDNWLKVTKL